MWKKLLDTGLGIVASFLPSLFGKTPTRKALDAMNDQAKTLIAVDQKQSKTITILAWILGAVILILLFVVWRRKK